MSISTILQRAASLTIGLGLFGSVVSLANWSMTPSPVGRVVEPLAIKVEASSVPTYAEELQILSRQLEKAYGLSTNKSEKFAEWIIEASLYADVPEILLSSLIMTESSFRTNVVSSVGAVGPGQIRMKYWRQFCPEADKDPKENVICAAFILREYYSIFCDSDWSCALRMYNVGPTNFREDGDYRVASLRYLRKVSAYAGMLDGNVIPYRFR